MEQLIYIEMNDKLEAAKLAGGFAVESTRTRAYVNALGVELAMKYLAQEGINVENVHNLHGVHNFREEFDIADIMLSNIHIDVRVVYDEDLIFIPKSHEEYGFTPDIYLVFKLATDSSHVKFLGFFEPRLINKNNANDSYYFIEKEKLSHPSDLSTYVQNCNGNSTEILPEDDLDKAKRLALSLIDHDITENEKKGLISLLKRSSSLREELTEFDNFEWVSYHTLQNENFEDLDEEENITEEEIVVSPIIDEFDVFEEEDEFTQLEGDIFDDVLEENIEENIEENKFDSIEENDIEAFTTQDIDVTNQEDALDIDEVQFEENIIEEDMLEKNIEVDDLDMIEENDIDCIEDIMDDVDEFNEATLDIDEDQLEENIIEGNVLEKDIKEDKLNTTKEDDVEDGINVDKEENLDLEDEIISEDSLIENEDLEMLDLADDNEETYNDEDFKRIIELLACKISNIAVR